jgi:hypothetical protein
MHYITKSVNAFLTAADHARLNAHEDVISHPMIWASDRNYRSDGSTTTPVESMTTVIYPPFFGYRVWDAAAPRRKMID